MIVWLTNHADRISVLMKSEIKFGSVISTRTHREVGAALASPQPPKPQAP